MSNGNVKNKIEILNKLFFYNLNFVFECSESLFNSLKIGWTNYTNDENSLNKKDRSLEKVYKNIEKLKNIEKKKIDEHILNNIVENNINYIENNYVDGNTKFKKKIINTISTVNSFSEIFSFLIESYNVYFNNSKKEVSTGIMLPRKKITLEERQSYVIDKNGYLYLNVIYENGAMIIDKKSIELEKKNYRKALQCDGEIFDKIDDNIKISPFEKKRRIYIQSMFDLEKNLFNLEQKSIDITYPVEKYFVYSKLIVDNLYKELTTFKENKTTVLNNLMNITIKNFGCNRLLNKYDFIVSKFEKEIGNVDKFVLDELLDTSTKMKQNEYIEFRNIDGIVPSIIDIYHAINMKLIRSVGIFLTDYIKNINNNVCSVTKYMSVDEIVEFYIELKNVLLNNSLNYTNKVTSYLVDLQKVVVNILKDRTDLEDEIILSSLLKEESLY